MNIKARRGLRLLAITVAVGSPIVGHLALVMGQGYGIALAFAAAQAVAAGIVLWTLPRHRWVGPAVTAALLLPLAIGAWQAPQTGLLASAGLAHALVYTALLAVFASSLRPGRTALVTTIASRLNPAFHAGMIPYTRAVTWAWCLFFATQLAVSTLLLATNPLLWRDFVTILHAWFLLAMLVGESLVRRRRWRHERSVGLLDTIRGVRRLMAQRAANAPTIL